jgi:hypothetical protein
MEPLKETIGIKGRLSIIELPHDMSDEELRYWLEPETELDPETGLYRIKRPARMSAGEQRSRTVLEANNLITNAGMTQLLNNMSVTGQGTMQTFAQIFSVGNGLITGVARTDTSVVGDGFASGSRKVPASFSIVGFTTTIISNFASGDAVSVWTNAGFYGFKVSGAQNATTTAGTGQLNTHVLFPFNKGAIAIGVAYSFSLTN